MNSQDCSKTDSWTTIESLPGKVGYPWETAAIQQSVFSPSGRWAVDITRKMFGFDKILVFMTDMATLTRKRYRSENLSFISNIVDMYWVSETEFVVVDYCFLRRTFILLYCHVDHQKSRVVPFIGKSASIPHSGMHTPKIASIRGAEPLYFEGKQFYVISQDQDLYLVPWNSFYTDEEVPKAYRIHIPRQHVEGIYSTYDLAFTYGSKIYMPVAELVVIEDVFYGYRYHPQKMLCIDVNKLQFEEKCVNVNDYPDAMELLKFECNNKDDIVSSTESVRYRQVGQYILGYTVDQYANADVKERTIFVVNLRENTLSNITVETGYVFFPTIYKDQLLVIRSDKVKRTFFGEEWVNKLIFKPLSNKKTPSLISLAQAAVIKRKRKIDPIYHQFLFPKGHCCIPTVDCFCKGILNSKYSNVHDAREIISNGLK